MKKRIFVLLMVLLCLFFALAAASCDDTPETPDNGGGNPPENELTLGGEETPAEGQTPHTHTWSAWNVTTPATCQVKGEETRTCNCGASETRVIAATEAHSFTAKSTDATYVHTAPTCQSVGVYYYKCATCTAKSTDTYNGESVADHSFTSKTQTVPYFKSAANCERPALYHYKCEWCNVKGEETYTVGSEQHNFTAKVQTATYLKSAANCQGPAEYYYKCSLCDDYGTNTYKVGMKTNHTPDSNHICTGCLNGYIYFGEYPQTLKAEDVTVTETQDLRGYYLGSDNAYYAKVTADPYGSGYKFLSGNVVTEGIVYYFKVEPILWRILAQSDDTAVILCDSIIANRPYADDDNSSYAESDIRTWLNSEFYNTAFTALERELIVTTTVNTSDSYVSETTNDNIFLLSHAEVTDAAYGFSTSQDSFDTARRMQTSDYSRAMGVGINTDSDDYGNGCWWIRVPSSNSCYICNVNYKGCTSDIATFVGSALGVVPALQICL